MINLNEEQINAKSYLMQEVLALIDTYADNFDFNKMYLTNEVIAVLNRHLNSMLCDMLGISTDVLGDFTFKDIEV